MVLKVMLNTNRSIKPNTLLNHYSCDLPIIVDMVDLGKTCKQDLQNNTLNSLFANSHY